MIYHTSERYLNIIKYILSSKIFILFKFYKLINRIKPKLNILIVDDEEFNITILKYNINKLGLYKVEQCYNG